MATATAWNECLLSIMGRGVVATEARLVGHGGAKARGPHVAQNAIRGQYGMRRGEWSFSVNVLGVEKIRCANPAQANDGKRRREPKAQVAKAVTSSEVLKVDTLRDRFGCPHAGHASVPQGRESVNRTQKQQRVRRRNVEEQPAMKQPVKTPLAFQLPFLFANILKIVKLGP